MLLILILIHRKYVNLYSPLLSSQCHQVQTTKNTKSHAKQLSRL
jgi:hypothetical protein